MKLQLVFHKKRLSVEDKVATTKRKLTKISGSILRLIASNEKRISLIIVRKPP